MSRPTKKFDPVIASEIQELRSRGVSIKDICSLVGITERSARKLYQVELEKGRSLANAAIVGKLYELAMQGNVTALIFWAKTQLGWKEKQAEQETDIELLKKGIASAYNSVGYGNQYGVLVTPGIMKDDQWQAEADKFRQAKE